MACPARSSTSAVAPVIRLRARPRRVLLVGNANVGKSVIFGVLTGRYAAVSKFPGTTVALTRGHARIDGEVFEVIDSPGIDTLDGALSEDEGLTHRLLSPGGPDVVVQVVDARSLRRGLLLTHQLTNY